nr:hypothetical protein [Catenibacterium mitsuokai]
MADTKIDRINNKGIVADVSLDSQKLNGKTLDQIKSDINSNISKSITEHINVIGYGIKEVNFNGSQNGYVLFTNGFLINVISAPNSMGEHDFLTIKFVKPFSTILFCGGLANTLNLGGDGDNKAGATVRSFDKNGATFVGSENSNGTPMAIAMGWA